jgi:hypothetical protein
MKAMKEIANINATKAGYATYFPFPEHTEQVAYAYGKYGWNASLLKGSISGALYYVSDFGNSTGARNKSLHEAMGAREHAVIDDLKRVEVVESSKERTTLKFIDSKGSGFTVTAIDDGHRWTICG